jgi:hypothetical protein
MLRVMIKRSLRAVMLSVGILIVLILSVIILGVIMLSVVMLSSRVQYNIFLH